MHRNPSNLRTKLEKSANNIISSKPNHKTSQIRFGSIIFGFLDALVKWGPALISSIKNRLIPVK